MNHQLTLQLQKRKSYLEKIIAEKEEAISHSPEGLLRFNRNGNRIQYYCRTDPKDTVGTYIKKQDLSLAAELAQKTYDKKIKKLALEELYQIQLLLKQYEHDNPDAVYEKLPEPRKVLVQPITLPDDRYIAEWLAVPYEKKGFSEDSPELYTARGERVRSKSEIIIADTLHRMHIPYRYEFPLKLKRFGTIHPDFTVLNVRLRKEYLWEHLGMMDDPGYSESALERISNYEKRGYYPGDRLILTHETKSSPIQTKLIESIISHYLL